MCRERSKYRSSPRTEATRSGSSPSVMSAVEGLIRGDRLEEVRQRLPVEHVGEGHRAAVTAGAAVEDRARHDQPGRVRVGERFEQDRLHEAEDRGVRADAEREREHRDGGPARRPAQQADALANVLGHCLERGEAPHLHLVFPDRRDVAELSKGRVARVVCRHAVADEPVREQCQVLLDLLRELDGRRGAPGAGPAASKANVRRRVTGHLPARVAAGGR